MQKIVSSFLLGIMFTGWTSGQISGGSDSKNEWIFNDKASFNKVEKTLFDSLEVILNKVGLPGYITGSRIYVVMEYNEDVWIATDNGRIAKSNNLTDWQLLNNGVLNEGINYIEFVDSNIIFAAGQQGRIYKTTNGGLNWNVCYSNSQQTHFINKIKFYNPWDGIAHGDQATGSSTLAILVTSDGGLNWSNHNWFLSGTGNNLSVEFEYPSFIFLSGWYNSGFDLYNGVWSSDDNGYSWDFQTVGNSPLDSVTGVRAVMFRDSQDGFAAKVDSTLWMTTDGGFTWNKIFKASQQIVGISEVPGNSSIYCYGTQGLIAKIDFEPEVFIRERSLYSNEWYYWGSFTDIDHGYLIEMFYSTSGFYTVSFNPTGNITDPVSRTFSLQQNYPNPFNPSTKLKYTSSSYSHISMEIYDILGNKIEILVNEEKPAGEYEITWYASDLPSGIYFCHYRAGDFIETRKMILIK